MSPPHIVAFYDEISKIAEAKQDREYVVAKGGFGHVPRLADRFWGGRASSPLKESLRNFRNAVSRKRMNPGKVVGFKDHTRKMTQVMPQGVAKSHVGQTKDVE